MTIPPTSLLGSAPLDRQTVQVPPAPAPVQHLGYRQELLLVVRIVKQDGREVLQVTLSKRLLSALNLSGGASLDVVPGSPWHLDVRPTAKPKLPERPGQTARFISAYRFNRNLFLAAQSGELHFELGEEVAPGFYTLHKVRQAVSGSCFGYGCP